MQHLTRKVFRRSLLLVLGLFALTAAPANAQLVVIDSVFGGDPPDFTVDTGNWVIDTTTSGSFNQSQLMYLAPPGTDPGSVTWTFTGLDVNLTYDVAATWVEDNLDGNSSIDAMYTVTGATTTGPLVVSQIDNPIADLQANDDFENTFDFQIIASVMPNASGVITLNLSDPTSGDVNFERADAALVSGFQIGDIDFDGDVDIDDLGILAGNWQQAIGGVGNGDIDKDNDVDIDDLGLLAGNWQYGVEVEAQGGLPDFDSAVAAAGIAVPEPTSLAIVGLGGLLLARRGRRRA